MEFYILYNTVFLTSIMFTPNLTRAHYLGLILGFVIWLAMFTLQGFGIYTMAKNRGFKKRFLAFVPFANLYYLGKIAGECTIFGQKMKYVGLYVMVAQIVATVYALLVMAAATYLFVVEGAPIVTEDASIFWGGTGFSAKIEKFYQLSSGYNAMGISILSIIQLIYELLALVLMLTVYKKYNPRSYMMLSMVTLFVPLARFVAIFALRNRKAVDYEAYIRAQREAYMRRTGGFNPYNPYANPYGNTQNGTPYSSNAGGRNEGQTAGGEDPFAEFSGTKNADEKPNETDDEFFR